MTKRETMQTMSLICDRALIVLANNGIKEQKLNLMMDLDYINDVCPLDFGRLLAFDDGNFGHDINGIYQNWNRATKELENCFCPRSASTDQAPVYGADHRPENDDPGPYQK